MEGERGERGESVINNLTIVWNHERGKCMAFLEIDFTIQTGKQNTLDHTQ